jgi:hypothetical protein
MQVVDKPLCETRPTAPPVLHVLIKMMVIIIVEPKFVPSRKQVGVRMEFHITTKLVELGSKMAGKKNVRDGDYKRTPDMFRVIIELR